MALPRWQGGSGSSINPTLTTVNIGGNTSNYLSRMQELGQRKQEALQRADETRRRSFEEAQRFDIQNSIQAGRDAVTDSHWKKDNEDAAAHAFNSNKNWNTQYNESVRHNGVMERAAAGRDASTSAYRDKALEYNQANSLASADYRDKSLEYQQANNDANNIYRNKALDAKRLKSGSYINGRYIPTKAEQTYDAMSATLPDFLQKHVQVDDKGNVKSIKTNDKALDKFNSKALAYYKKQSKNLSVQSLTPEQQAIQDTIKKLENDPTRSREVQGYKAKLAESVNATLGRRDRSWLEDGINGIESQFNPSDLESEIEAFKRKATGGGSSNMLDTSNYFDAGKLSPQKKVEYGKLLDKKKIVDIAREKQGATLSYSDIVADLDKSKKLSMDLANMYKDDSSFITREYGKKDAVVPTTLDEQEKLITDYKNNYIAKTNKPASQEDVISMISEIESNGKANAASPYSTAKGEFQLTDKTNATIAKRLGMTPQEARKPANQRKVLDELLKDHSRQLSNLGLEQSPVNIYKIHQLGSPTMKKVANGNYDTGVMVSVMNNFNASDRRRLGITGSYLKDGKLKTSQIPSDAGTRAKLVHAWEKKYEDKVNGIMAKAKGSSGTYLNPLIIKQLDAKLKAINTRRGSKSKEAVAKAKAQGIATKESIKDVSTDYRTAYKQSVAIYNKNPELYSKAPNLADYRLAGKTGKDYPSLKRK